LQQGGFYCFRRRASLRLFLALFHAGSMRPDLLTARDIFDQKMRCSDYVVVLMRYVDGIIDHLVRMIADASRFLDYQAHSESFEIG